MREKTAGALMKHVHISKEDHIALITLDNPPTNNLNISVMDDLIEAHNICAADDDVWAVILTGGGKFLSNGLDPEFLLSLDEEGRGEVFQKLLNMLGVMYGFPKLELAAINGHAMAGGAVLAILTDFRFMASAGGRYCFSEVRVGLTIPSILLNIIERVVGPQEMVNVAMLAKAYKPEEALNIRLIDRICEPEKLIPEARQYLKSQFDLPLASMNSVKTFLRKPIVDRIQVSLDSELSQFRKFLGGNFVEGLSAVKERRRPKFSNP